MFELYIIRHGLAGKSLEDKTMDEERSLTKKGKEKVKEISKGLNELKISFDVVLTSPLLRAKETAEIINAYCGENKEVVITDLLKPDSSYNSLVKFLNQFKEHEKVAVVGHEPFLSGFASYCLSKNQDILINLKKGGILMLEIDQKIKPGQCILSWLMKPKQISKSKRNY